MRIKTIEQSFSDYPGEIAYIIGLGGCNFRCGYCHNVHLSRDHEKYPSKDEKEILDFLEGKRKFTKCVVISGGEPTIHENLPKFVKKLKDLGLSVKLDTNGSNFNMLERLLEEELVDYVAMDVKTVLTHKLYDALITRKADLYWLERSMSLIKGSNIDYMFRTTVVPGLHDELVVEEICKLLKGGKRYQIQNFHPENGTLNPEYSKIVSFSRETLERFKEIAAQYFDEVLIRE